ncbi:hypothetical protein M1413_03960 [Patescibacteria group bacterium]|jgi:transposase-like protein|nr:hypothetical protein [Patescibacteria group bacterium]MCL5114859.1 hypothetical protein [Patescibacteria group bacterium]
MSGNVFYKKGRYKRKIQERKKLEFAARVAEVNSKRFKSKSKKWDRDTRKVSKGALSELYWESGKSMQEMAKILGCSQHKVSYWMNKYKILRRDRSEATYQKRNPLGDPFLVREPKNLKEAELMGMGLGLYWGEGTRASRNSIRLGNTDPALIRIFIKFLRTFFAIDGKKLRFGLQVFNDGDSGEALNFWVKHLGVDKHLFQKVVVTPSRGGGIYRRKMNTGVLTIYFNNKKLRNVIVGKLKDYEYVGE